MGLFLCLFLVGDVLFIDDRQNKKYKKCIKIFVFKKGKLSSTYHFSEPSLW